MTEPRCFPNTLETSLPTDAPRDQVLLALTFRAVRHFLEVRCDVSEHPDAAWVPPRLLSDSAAVSFESFATTGGYLRHDNYPLVTRAASTATDRADATFFLE